MRDDKMIIKWLSCKMNMMDKDDGVKSVACKKINQWCKWWMNEWYVEGVNDNGDNDNDDNDDNDTTRKSFPSWSWF